MIKRVAAQLLTSSGGLFFLLAGIAYAEEPVSCKGNITSKQGEGLVVKTFRFEVNDLTGSDLKDVLEKCKKITRQRQEKARHANPALAFRKFSDLDLECSKGADKFPLRRTLDTSP